MALWVLAEDCAVIIEGNFTVCSNYMETILFPKE